MDTIHNSVGFASLTTSFFSTMLRISSKKKVKSENPAMFSVSLLKTASKDGKKSRNHLLSRS